MEDFLNTCETCSGILKFFAARALARAGSKILLFVVEVCFSARTFRKKYTVKLEMIAGDVAIVIENRGKSIESISITERRTPRESGDSRLNVK